MSKESNPIKKSEASPDTQPVTYFEREKVDACPSCGQDRKDKGWNYELQVCACGFDRSKPPSTEIKQVKQPDMFFDREKVEECPSCGADRADKGWNYELQVCACGFDRNKPAEGRQKAGGAPKPGSQRKS